ncbi:MAG: hypothetical protein ACYS8W_04905 [Planctomycetota bacterium]
MLKITSCTQELIEGLNNATCTFTGTGSPLIQLVWTYYRSSTPPPASDLTIAVNYSKTTLTISETTLATVTIANTHTSRGANIVVAEIGLPPSFNLNADSLETARLLGTIDRYEVKPLKLIVYRTLLDPQSSFMLSYELTPTMPCKVLAPSSKVYEYYAPEEGEGIAAPVLITVTE